MAERLRAVVRLRQREGRESESTNEELQLSVSADGRSLSLASATPTSAASTQQQSSFIFDGVFSSGEEDGAVYRGGGVRKIVESALLGYNGTLLFLQVGEGEAEGLRDSIRRAAEQIFACIRKSRSSRSAANLIVNCSFVAVAKENVYDLLDDSSGDVELSSISLMEDNQLQTSLLEADSPAQVFDLLARGEISERRLVESLGMEGEKRFHHTILSLTVEFSHFGSMNAPISGTLSFIRLSSAHSLTDSRQRLTGADNTNQTTLSLVSLAEAVEALQEQDCPEVDEAIYSKSVLTRLLRDALGGNCKSVFICELAQPLPSSSLSETRAALQLTSRARQVCNWPNKRDLAEKALMSAYMKQLRQQYHMSSEENEGEEGTANEDERRQAMEQAASALAQAVGGVDAEVEAELVNSEEARDRIVVVSAESENKSWGVAGRGAERESRSGVTIDALVGVLQDPDRGVPRALETRLKDVKIRRDVGALFSGAGIVQWMLGNVEGVENERDAVTLGQLLLDEGAIFHSEGSMVFANSDSLFYYAREARLGKRLLSPQEIQDLLSQARDTGDLTHTTSVSASQREPAERRESEGPDQSLGFSPTTEEGEGRGWEDGGLQMSGGFEYIQRREKLDEASTGEDVTEPPVDHSGVCGGEGEVPTGSHTSVESWMAAETTDVEEEGEGERREEEGNPSITLQQDIPSIHTLENSQDYPHPLHMAVAIGKNPGVIKNLVMMFGVDQTDDQGRTPLMFAALGNKRSSCSTLIECGAVCDKQDVSGLTALHVACYHGSKEATRVLLAKKASVVTADRMGHTAYHWSVVPENTACLQLLLHHAWPGVLKQADCSGLTAMHWAIFYNRPQHLKLLLKKCAGSVEVDSSGRTLLTYAIERDPPTPHCITVLLEVCQQLLTQTDSNGRLPLHLASIANSPVPLSLLLSHRPLKSGHPTEVNCLDPLLRTPLHYSAAANQFTNTQVLLGAGADRDLADSEGRTAVNYAALLGEVGEAMMSLLQTADTIASPSCPDRRPATTATTVPPPLSPLHSPSTHSLPPPPPSSAPLIQHTDDPSKVCTLL